MATLWASRRSLLAAGVLVAVAAAPVCGPGSVPNSNTSRAPCAGGAAAGARCAFACDAGFLAVGEHVCQSYTTVAGVPVVEHAYFGGRCLPLCGGAAASASASACGPGSVPVRVNATAAGGAPWCLSTTCMPPAEALLRLARGNYALWRRARYAPTGMTAEHFDIAQGPGGQAATAHLGTSAIALMLDCAAVALNFTARADAQARANVTLSAFAGELPGFAISRQAAHGWLPTFFSKVDGSSSDDVFTVFDTGSNAAAVLFAREWWTATSAAGDASPAARALTANIARLAKKIFNAVDFKSFPVNATGWPAPDGTYIPASFTAAGGAPHAYPPLADGMYQFNELHYTVWLMYGQACPGAPSPGACAAAGPARMWEAWQRRRLHPQLQYAGFPLLTYWPSYVTQLPFYLAASFSADAEWAALFRASWGADRAYYAGTAYYSSAPRYGLAAGATDPACAMTGGGYEADQIAPGSVGEGRQGCKMHSPYAVAGYLPAAPGPVAADVLALLAEGDAVLPAPDLDAGDVVLVRRSLLEPAWRGDGYITSIDFCSELLGLSAHLLGADFYPTYAAHDFAALTPSAPEWQPAVL